MCCSPYSLFSWLRYNRQKGTMQLTDVDSFLLLLPLGFINCIPKFFMVPPRFSELRTLGFTQNHRFKITVETLLKELQESMDRCTDSCDITEILLKIALYAIHLNKAKLLLFHRGSMLHSSTRINFSCVSYTFSMQFYCPFYFRMSQKGTIQAVQVFGRKVKSLI